MKKNALLMSFLVVFFNFSQAQMLFQKMYGGKTTKSNTFKTVNPTIVNENALENSINIYPNPGTGEFEVESFRLKIQSVELFNMYGEKVHSEMTNHTLRCHQPNGIYFAHIKTDRGFSVQKVVINH